MLLNPCCEACTNIIPYSGDTFIAVISLYSLLSQCQGKYNRNELELSDNNKRLFGTIDLNMLYCLNS